VFNYITGYAEPAEMERMAVSPLNLRQRVCTHIDQEIVHARNGEDARRLLDRLICFVVEAARELGTVTTSEDDALSATPNCQTTRSPLYDCTNQPIPCGRRWPVESVCGVQAVTRKSG